MSNFRKGQSVTFNVGRGTSTGKISGFDGDYAVITTANGKSVRRRRDAICAAPSYISAGVSAMSSRKRRQTANDSEE